MLVENKIVKKSLAIICSFVMCCVILTGCTSSLSAEDGGQNADHGKLQVITTIFPYYDFVRVVAGDLVDVKMIIPAGMDTHSFEPTASDMVTIGKADLFIYNGGEMESWVPQVIEAAANHKLKSDSMMKHVQTVVEETVEGMEAEHDEGDVKTNDASSGEEEVEYDEHIWTSPVNAQKIVNQIATDLSQADPEHEKQYQDNAAAYVKKLKTLDQEFQDIVNNTEKRYLVFADRFPLRYFVEQYGLEYTAAFAGCSSDTEPSADTIAYLTDQVKERALPVVLKIELTSDKVAQSIAESTGAKVETINTCHNVTKQQLEDGVSYLDLMEQNVQVLQDALQ